MDKLYVVLSSSEKYDRMVCKRDGIKYMPVQERLSWLGALLAKHFGNLVPIIHIVDRPEDDEHDWEYGAKQVKAQIIEQITHIFSSEPTYSTHFSKYYPEAKHVVVDPERKSYPISSTDIRKDPWMNWQYLTEEGKGFLCKKVAVVGTESCGKSTLVSKLAKKYATTSTAEVGRSYCDQYSNQLTESLFNDIAMQHWLVQKDMAAISNQVTFIDSDAIITQYYLKMYLGKESPLIEEVIKLQEYDLVLYLEPDVPWVADGLRFAGNEAVRLRNNRELNNMYVDRGVTFYDLRGNYAERLKRAVECVELLLQGKI